MLAGKVDAPGIAELLAGGHGLILDLAPSMSALIDRARSGRVDVVVFEADRGEGWPVEAAERMAVNLREVVPLIVVCGAAHDQDLMEQCLAGTGATVLRHEPLTAELLQIAVRGMLAKW
jgi:hypothetical protein